MRKNNALTLRPFHYVTPSISTMTVGMLCVLIPHLVMLIITSSFQSLLIILACGFASFVAEALDAYLVRRRTMNIPVTLLQGVLTGMFLPANYPVVSIFFIMLVTLFIAKYPFGGIAGSWVNPVAISIVMAYFVGAIWFPTYIISPLYLQSHNASLMLINDGVFPVFALDTTITNYLNSNIFSRLGTNIPEGYISLLWDTGSTIPAFRFNLLTLLGSLILFSIRSLNWEVPVSFIFTYSLFVWLLCPVFVGGSIGNGDIILALLTGGTLFMAFFVLSWFGTVPVTVSGKIFFGALTGIAAFFISGYGLSPVGAMFSVFCGNIFSLIIQMIEHWRGERQFIPAVQSHSHTQEHN